MSLECDAEWSEDVGVVLDEGFNALMRVGTIRHVWAVGCYALAVFQLLLLVGCAHDVVAAAAYVEVHALVAMPAEVCNGGVASTAQGATALRFGVLQVVQQHNGRVLRPSQRIELQMLELAHL